MDRTINEVDDDGLTTPLIANLSLNSDADGDDVPLVQPPVLGLWCVQRESILLKTNRSTRPSQPFTTHISPCAPPLSSASYYSSPVAPPPPPPRRLLRSRARRQPPRRPARPRPQRQVLGRRVLHERAIACTSGQRCSSLQRVNLHRRCFFAFYSGQALGRGISIARSLQPAATREPQDGTHALKAHGLLLARWNTCVNMASISSSSSMPAISVGICSNEACCGGTHRAPQALLRDGVRCLRTRI